MQGCILADSGPSLAKGAEEWKVPPSVLTGVIIIWIYSLSTNKLPDTFVTVYDKRER